MSKASLCAAGLAALLGLAGCAQSPVPAAPFSAAIAKASREGLCRCPQPVHYSDAQIKAISAALRALPDNNPLQQAMSDYEDERDSLRICLGR
ncbi:MAG: hypothetical protein ACREE4_19535 [Stellaceae bacterium]